MVYDYTVKAGPVADVRLFGDIKPAIEFAHGSIGSYLAPIVPVMKSVRRDDGFFGWDPVYEVLRAGVH